MAGGGVGLVGGGEVWCGRPAAAELRTVGLRLLVPVVREVGKVSEGGWAR